MTSGHKKELNRKAEGQDKRNQIEMKEKDTTSTGNISNSYLKWCVLVLQEVSPVQKSSR